MADPGNASNFGRKRVLSVRNWERIAAEKNLLCRFDQTGRPDEASVTV
jgi:hypothetical protein